MSGYSTSWMRSAPLTVGELRQHLVSLPDHLEIHVPSINRIPGQFIGADHVFVDVKEGYVSIDGDIAEVRNDGRS